MTRTLEDAGGIVVAAGHPAAARVVAAGLHGMQHRGLGGACLAVGDGATIRGVHGEGRVDQAIQPDALVGLPGGFAIGMVEAHGAGARLATGHSSAGRAAVAVAGAITNAPELWREALEHGAVASAGSDAELVLHLIARSTQRTFVNRLVDAVWKVQGAYTLAALTPDRLVVLRDPGGFRPLWLGQLGDAVVVASDDQAIECLGGQLVRPLRPGEMLIVDARGVQSIAPLPSRPTSVCTQELLTLAPRAGRPFAEPSYTLRHRLGAMLADRAPAPAAEVVVAAPGASQDIAAGYAMAAQLRQAPAFVAQPTSPYLAPDERNGSGPSQLRVVSGAVVGQGVVLIAGSMTHGHDLRRAISDLMAAGARSVHVRCGAPPIRLACPYGMRIRGAEALAASRHPEREALASWLGATSVEWVAPEELGEVLGAGRCEACLSNQLPLEVREAAPDDQLALFRDA